MEKVQPPENTCCPGAELVIGFHDRHLCWFCHNCQGPLRPLTPAEEAAEEEDNQPREL